MRTVFRIAVLALVVVFLFVSACASPSAPAPTSPPAAAAGCPNPHGENGKCKVVLANSFLGNDYRVFMQQTAVKASQKEPFASEWEELQIINTENTAEAQNAALENVLAQGVDAILLNSVSDNSATDVIKKACDQGVLVVSFDVTNKSDAPCMYRIDFNMKDYTRPEMTWVGKKLGCEGNVILDKGLEGVSIADDLYQGMLEGLNDACGDKIQVVGTYYGQFGPGPTESAIAALLPTNPQIDAVSTDWAASSIWKPFKDAGRELPVVRFSYNNADAVTCVQENLDCVTELTSWASGIGAMDTAYKIWHGQDVPRQQFWPYRLLATDNSIDIGQPYEKLEIGVNAFPDKPANYTPFFNWPGAVVQLTEEEAYGE
jgi:ABC-type sugar transport system substrate-binding protein